MGYNKKEIDDKYQCDEWDKMTAEEQAEAKAEDQMLDEAEEKRYLKKYQEMKQ